MGLLLSVSWPRPHSLPHGLVARIVSVWRLVGAAPSYASGNFCDGKVFGNSPPTLVRSFVWALTGYGYRIWRIVVASALALVTCAAIYFAI